MYQLKVNQQKSIVALHEQGWSGRRIARELGPDRGTVRIYLAGISKPATPHTGSADADPSKPATDPHTGSVGMGGPASLCEPWREQIEQALARGLSIQRIYQDLVTQRQFAGSYYAVRRFVLRRVPVNDLESNWAYMVMTALAWNLKAWFALLMPERERGLELLKMEFRGFLQAVIQLPCQIVRTGRKLVYRILSYNGWLKDFFATFERITAMSAALSGP